MSRPRRSASQKTNKQEEEQEEASNDELELSEASSDGDFSNASSDEWEPSKITNGGNEETIEESDHTVSEDSEDEDEESAVESPVKNTRRKSHGNRSIVASLRGTTGNKFKRNQVNRISSSSNLQEILQRSQFQKKKSIFDDSKNDSREKSPDFDCSGGLHLSDSDDFDDDKPTTSTKVIENVKKQPSALVNSINQASTSTMVDLMSVHNNLKEMEDAKKKLLNYKSSKSTEKVSSGSQKENFNIADLLKIGEVGPEPSTSHKKSSQKLTRGDDSDSDGWQEVEDEQAPVYKVPKQGVEIMLNECDPEGRTKKIVKPVDIEAQLKRKINRRRKEFQVCLHKVSLMSWIMHGNFVNRRINDADLMKGALALLPKNKNHCYPKDKTDVDYFQQITKWFKSTITLCNKKMYTDFKTRPPIMMSLALQMKFKAAISVRDYVLIFTILLRAIGIQCRMVQSLVLAPIYPPKADLMSLATKKPEEKSKSSSSSTSKSKSSGSSKSKSKSRSSNHNSSSAKRSSSSKSKKSSKSDKKSPEKSSRSSRSKNKKSSDPPTIPQLDGGDDQATASKSRKPLKIKALPGYKVDESYVDIAKDENSNPKKKANVKLPDRIDSKSHNVSSPTVTKMAPKVRFSLDSPNRRSPTSSPKLFKSKNSSKTTVRVETLKVFSPRKTRSTSRDASPQPGTSKQTVSTNKNSKSKPPINAPQSLNKKEKVEEFKKSDLLQVFSPRRLRSRSRSNDEPLEESGASTSKKPNLKTLQKSQDRKRPAAVVEKIDNKKAKIIPSAAGKKRPAEKEEVQSKKAKTSDKELNKEIAQKSENDGEEFEPESDDSIKYFKDVKKNTTKKKSKPSTSAVIDRRVLSSDSEHEAEPASPSKQSKGIDIWVEVYSEKDERWIAIDVMRGKVDCVKEIIKTATHPMTYVFAWNNDKSLKDVSARYCASLNTVVRKLRVDSKYLETILLQFAGQKTSRDIKEDNELNKLQLEKPMPTSIAQFKNHPLFALRRHLLKYEAIYPPEPPILGYIREEAIYPRDCVFVLHTRETWLKEARVVKLNEKPYKMSKTLKWDNVLRKILKDIPQELFGIWQTKDYEPPVAKDGMVPRNAYGNVELFKPSMLPIGTVHIQLPGLNKVCKKIGVDCSQAIVGFDSSGGWPYPVYDGFIVCEEFQEKVIDAWNREQEEIEKKENEKYEKRVYGNWKKLIKGLLIRQRLKNKYNFEGNV